MPNPAFRAVLFDFGGVLTESPFRAFAHFERSRGLPEGFLRRVNSIDPDANAWARYERSEVTLEEFDRAFEAESRQLGYPVRGTEIVWLLYGELRPSMVEALRRCGAHYLTACLTNNVNTGSGHGLPTFVERAAEVQRILDLFDVVIESSKTGARKPEPRFYEMALAQLRIEPQQAVYLDDLGVNLKPARAMGMTTIKVESAPQALAELERILDLPLTY